MDKKIELTPVSRNSLTKSIIKQVYDTGLQNGKRGVRLIAAADGGFLNNSTTKKVDLYINLAEDGYNTFRSLNLYECNIFAIPSSAYNLAKDRLLEMLYKQYQGLYKETLLYLQNTLVSDTVVGDKIQVNKYLNTSRQHDREVSHSLNPASSREENEPFLVTATAEQLTTYYVKNDSVWEIVQYLRDDVKLRSCDWTFRNREPLFIEIPAQILSRNFRIAIPREDRDINKLPQEQTGLLWYGFWGL